MHYESVQNPSRKFYTIDDLEAAQAEAKATGDLAKCNEVFILTWVDDTGTGFVPNGQ